MTFFFFFIIFPGNVDVLGPFPAQKFQCDLLFRFVQLYRRTIILKGLINLFIFFQWIPSTHQALALPLLGTGAICDASYRRAQTHPEHLLLPSVALL